MFNSAAERLPRKVHCKAKIAVRAVPADSSSTGAVADVCCPCTIPLLLSMRSSVFQPLFVLYRSSAQYSVPYIVASAVVCTTVAFSDAARLLQLVFNGTCVHLNSLLNLLCFIVCPVHCPVPCPMCTSISFLHFSVRVCERDCGQTSTA